ncbi:MAG: uroporphyrinogen-III synthase [Halioglobus sp.]
MRNKPVVLVTRPQGQGQPLSDALISRGYPCQSLPLLQLHGLEALSSEAEQHLAQLDQFQHIIFISTNAVHYGMPRLASAGTLPVDAQWYAIGSATAGRLSEHGVAVTAAAGPMTTESLLAHPSLRDLAGQRVLIVKGVGGRISLRKGLQSRGARVDEFECYRRQCPSMATGALLKYLTEWQIGLILISSGEGLNNMVELLGGSLTHDVALLPLVVPSTRVLEQAGELGFKNVQQAVNASDPAVLDAVEAWWQASL